MLQTQKSMLIAAAIAAAFAVSACDRADVGRSPSTGATSRTDTSRPMDKSASSPSSSMTDKSASSTPSPSDSSTASKAPDTSNMVAAAKDDTAITTKVKQQIMADPTLKTKTIKVETKDGTVTLTGTVDTQDMRQQAHQIAAGTPGVSNVVDNLTVKNAG